MMSISVPNYNRKTDRLQFGTLIAITRNPQQGKPHRWAVRVSANYRITFGWSGEDAVDVDFEDYH